MNSADVEIEGKGAIDNAYFRTKYDNNTWRTYYLKPTNRNETKWSKSNIPTSSNSELTYEVFIQAQPGTSCSGKIKRTKSCILNISGKTDKNAKLTITDPKKCK